MSSASVAAELFYSSICPNLDGTIVCTIILRLAHWLLKFKSELESGFGWVHLSLLHHNSSSLDGGEVEAGVTNLANCTIAHILMSKYHFET